MWCYVDLGFHTGSARRINPLFIRTMSEQNQAILGNNSIWNLRQATKSNPNPCRWVSMNCTIKKATNASQKRGKERLVWVKSVKTRIENWAQD